MTKHAALLKAATRVVGELADFENMTEDAAAAMRSLRAVLRDNGVCLTVPVTAQADRNYLARLLNPR